MSANLIQNGDFSQGVDVSGNPIGWNLFKSSGEFTFPSAPAGSFSYRVSNCTGVAGIRTRVEVLPGLKYRISFSGSIYVAGVNWVTYRICFYKSSIVVGSAVVDYINIPHTGSENTIQGFEFTVPSIDFDTAYFEQSSDIYEGVDYTTNTIGNVSLVNVPPYMLESQPESYSLSSAVKDFVITPEKESIVFTLSYLGNIILSEAYTRDANNKIFIRNIGDVCRDYLVGGIVFTDTIRNDVEGVFSASIDGFEEIPFTVLRCDAICDSLPVKLLATSTNDRVTNINSVEYITFKMSAGGVLKLYLLRFQDGVVVSELVDSLITAAVDSIITKEVSPSAIDYNSISDGKNDAIGYKIDDGTTSISFFIDAKDYQSFKCFLFKNCFGLNETISVTGPSKRKAAIDSTTGYFNGLAKRVFTKRDDQIEVDFGVPESLEEYLRLRDFFASTETYLRVGSQWVEIIITDIKDENDERLSQFTPISFTYKYSNHKQNFRI